MTQQPRLITIANQKGGVGKTTSAVNLAAALAHQGHTVLVIDLDPQGNASTALGVEHRTGTNSSYEVLLGNATAKQAVQQSPNRDNLWCIPATIDLAGAEIEFGFDYVFIDCPPSLGLLTINAMTAVQEVIIPIQCEYYALEGVGQLLNNITMIREHLNADLHISGVLLTMYDGRTKLAEQVVDEVRGQFGAVVLGNVIPRSVRVSEAPGYGQTVIDYSPSSHGAYAYGAAAKELDERGDYVPHSSTGPIGVSPEIYEQLSQQAGDDAADNVAAVDNAADNDAVASNSADNPADEA